MAAILFRPRCVKCIIGITPNCPLYYPYLANNCQHMWENHTITGLQGTAEKIGSPMVSISMVNLYEHKVTLWRK